MLRSVPPAAEAEALDRIVEGIRPAPTNEVPGYIAALDSSRGTERLVAVLALGRSGHSKMVAGRLAEASRDEEYTVRFAACWALNELRADQEEAVEAISSRLRDRRREVRSMAAMSLACIGEREPAVLRPSILSLSAALGDPEAPVRAYSAWALQAIGPQARGAIPGLLDCLDDADWRVRWRATMALAAIDPESEATREAIQGLASDPNDLVRDAALDALRQCQGLTRYGRGRPQGLDVRADSDGAAAPMRTLYGEWVVKSVIKTSADKSNCKESYEGRTIRVAPDVLDCLLFAVEKPRYALEEVRQSHQEGEVPSRAFKRTSAFEFYEQDRELVHVIRVHDQNGDYHGMLEFIKEKDEIVVMDGHCVLIAERKGRASKGSR